MNTIRRAKSQDIPGINHLLNQVLLVHHIGRPDLFKEIGQKYTEDKLIEMINDDENPIWVCVDENENVLAHCFCQISVREETSSSFPYKTIYIDDLCVDETCRKQNIGTQIYQFVKDYAAKNGFYNVTLHAWECNPTAVAFYKSLGMQIQQYTMEEIVGNK